MTGADALQSRYPLLADRLPKVPLADLPTPVEECRFRLRGRHHRVWIKLDNLTSTLYGGNKVRKLEYLLGRSTARDCRRVATFGAVGSNHALATALYARRLSLQPVCFLMHQTRTKLAAATLNMHVENRSLLVPFGGTYAERLKTLRKHLWGGGTDVIPMGGSSWIGTVGPVSAGLELAEQVGAGELERPERVYLACGTMGTAAGIALGLALVGLTATVHAVRVSHASIANEAVLRRLMAKTVYMLNRLEPSFPAQLAERARIVLRHDYFEPGYARSNDATDAAIERAADQAGLKLEPTYTGKAMAALFDDLAHGDARGERVLFWNTYHSASLPVDTDKPIDPAALPEEFLSYFR